MLRCFVPSLRCYGFSPLTVSSRRCYTNGTHVDPSDMFGKREKTLEDLAVKEHEARLIQKYREELKKKEAQLKAAEDKLANMKTATSETEKSSSTSSSQSLRDIEEKFYEFRREIMTKIRTIEDDIYEIKHKLKM
jgi:predicted  nucleic acid-binding Zn-ribbon protein